MVRTEFERRVFFWGPAASADAAIRILGSAGVQVFALLTDGGVQPPAGETPSPGGQGPGARILRGGRVLAIEGRIGRFRVTLADAAGTRIACDAGVLLIDGNGTVPAGSIPGGTVCPSGNLMSISDLEHLARERGPEGAPAAIAVWLDPEEGFPDRNLADRAFRSLHSIARDGRTAIHVLCRHVPLSGLGGQEVYDELRGAGVRFFRLGETSPRFSANGGRVAISLDDRTLPTRPVLLEVDRLVTVGRPVSRESTPEIARLTAEPLDSGGFLQKDNAHLYPHRAFRKGVYFVGPGRGEHSDEELGAEVQAVLAELGEALRSGFLEARERLEIDKGRCVSCLTCFRVCPHRALEIGLAPVPVPVQAACQGCGLCAALCPGRAIRLLDQTGQGQAHTGAAALPRGQGPGHGLALAIGRTAVVFACSRPAVPGRDSGNGRGIALPGNVELVSLPCACALSEEMLLEAFLQGAARVLVLGCHEDNCVSQKGTEAGRRRIQRFQEVLRAAGRDSADALRFVSAAPNEACRVSRLIHAWASPEGDQGREAKTGPRPAAE